MLTDILRPVGLFFCFCIVALVLLIIGDEIDRQLRWRNPNVQPAPNWRTAAKDALLFGPLVFAILWFALGVTP